MAGYRRPSAPFNAEYEVKKSRFIVDLLPCQGDHKAALAQIRQQHPKAGHHCWAYRIGDGLDQDSSDDGEPRGTAGKPMAAMLQGLEVGDCLAVISRYFGGIKLGTGGLVRAYSQSLRSAIEACPMHAVEPTFQLTLSFAYDQSGYAESLRRSLDAEVLSSEFTVRCCQTWQVAMAQGPALVALIQAQAHLGFKIHKQ